MILPFVQTNCFKDCWMHFLDNLEKSGMLALHLILFTLNLHQFNFSMHALSFVGKIRV